MTAAERADFIRQLCRNVEETILSRVNNMPDDWDDQELRRYIADRFEEQNLLLARGKVRRYRATKRLAAFNNVVATNPNL